MTSTGQAGTTPGFDVREFRNALGAFVTGVTIVATVTRDGKPIGFTCNSFSSVSLSPPLILWSLSLRSPSLQAFLQAPHFSINVLGVDQQPLSQRFSTPISGKFEGVEYAIGENGTPLLAGAAAHLECLNEIRHYTGDHVIFIGRVLHFSYTDAEPLVFHRGRYMALQCP